MKTAVVQMCSGGDLDRNICSAEHAVRQAAGDGAELIVLPEVFVYRGAMDRKTRARIAEPLHGELTGRFRGLAKECRTGIVLGSFYEQIPGTDRVYNTCMTIDDNGEVLGIYRKQRLFQAVLKDRTINEAATFKAGRRKCVFTYCRFRMGCAICYDLRFSEIFQRYASAGCDVLAVPSAFTHETGKLHWETLVRARAIDCQAYVLAANQCGRGAGGARAFGSSMIVDPWGCIVARASAGRPETIFADISRSVVRDARRKIGMNWE
ncbi:MAG: carbon-nitrogen hydrolase family protein [Candidatus Omnitrophota bacterium]